MPRTRALIALFLIGMALQGVTGILMHHRGPGWTPTSIAAYYAGSKAAAVTPTPAADGLEAPAMTGGEIRPARSFGTLLESAHFHLVAMPLVLFVVAHLFAMTPWGRATWAAVVTYATFACAFADIAAPFAVRYLGESWAAVKLVAFLGLEAGFLLMTLLTLAGVAALAGTGAPPPDAARASQRQAAPEPPR